MRRFLPLLLTALLLAAAALLGPGRLQAQSRTLVKVNPSTLLNEVNFSLEQQFGKVSALELGAGFIYTDYWDYVLNRFDFGQIKPHLSEHQYLSAKGFNLSLGYRYYVVPMDKHSMSSRGTYFQPTLLYKVYYYPTDQKQIDTSSYPESGMKFVAGLQLFVGRQYRWRKLYIDKYIGLGIKAKTYRFDHYQASQSTGNVSNNGLQTTSWLPSIQIGLKLGFGL